MKFYSTNRNALAVSFKEAVFKSLPPDNGLYFPESIPNLSFLNSETLELPEIGYEVLKPFASNEIESIELRKLTKEALNFEIPLVEIEKNIHSLELFHGPTYAFKDVGARILARFLGHFNQHDDQEITILVATSGDTGGAVASGFYGVEGVNVIILYPSGKVSELQEKQLTTLGKNIRALEVNGTFDDCQALVKQAFLDTDLNQKLNLSSANSINIARWIPQSIYYFWACQQLKDKELVFSVPSGNYGNLAAGILAKKMGAEIKRFIASSNLNDVVPRYIETGSYEPRSTVQTYSNAMDVGKPSNFPRMLELYNQDYNQLISDIQGDRIDDSKTLEIISECKQSNDYILDPHGAIGYQLLKMKRESNETGIFLETAHPCKFLPVLEKVMDYKLPEFTKNLLNKSKQSEYIESDYQTFKACLFS